jgi:hypothetical protein
MSEVPAGAVLNVAVVEHRATTSVRRGENAGKTLRHANVVRGFVSVPLTAPTGSLTVHFPVSLARDHAELTAFVQRETPVAGMPVLDAARAPLRAAVSASPRRSAAPARNARPRISPFSEGSVQHPDALATRGHDRGTTRDRSSVSIEQPG